MNNNEFLASLSNIINSDKSLDDNALIIEYTNNNIIGTDNTDNEYLDLLSSNCFTHL